MPGALEDIAQKRIVLLPRAWKYTENGDRVYACPSRISKYEERGFQLSE